MYQQNEEDLKILQQLIPGATIENLQAFQQCMKTDAIFKSALPYGITTAVISHFLIPKRLGAVKSLLTAFVGCAAYTFGKIMYSPICKEKVFGPVNPFAVKPEERRSLHDNSSYIGNIDQQDQQGKLVISSDKLLEDDSSWSNFDPFLDSNISHSEDTGNDFQDELILEQPVDVKKRVTYDDLWAQHRDSRMNEQYRDSRGSIPINKERPAVPPQRISERSTPLQTIDEKNVWS